jgi:hypothetical protein
MTSPNPQDVLKLAADMVAAQKHLDTLKAQWDSLFAGSGLSVSAEVKPGRRAHPEGISSRIFVLMESEPNSVFDTALLQERLGISREQVEPALYNLFAAGKVKRVSRGKYQAKEGTNDSFGF